MPRSRAAHWLLLRSRRGAGAVHIISTLPPCRSFAPVDPQHLLLARPRRRRSFVLAALRCRASCHRRSAFRVTLVKKIRALTVRL